MYSPAKDLKIERNIGRFADINQYTGLRLKTSFGRSTQLIKPLQKSAQLPLTNILWEERFDFSFTSKRFFIQLKYDHAPRKWAPVILFCHIHNSLCTLYM